MAMKRYDWKKQDLIKYRNEVQKFIDDKKSTLTDLDFMFVRGKIAMLNLLIREMD